MLSKFTRAQERRKTVIEKLQQRSWHFKELMAETEIPEKTFSRILKELGFYGLAVKKSDGAWGWYLCRQAFSPRDYELMIRHSEHIVFGDSEVEGIEQAPPYALLQSYENETLEQRFPEFAGHLRTGYQDLFALFRRWVEIQHTREILEKSERRVAEENIIRQVGGDLAVIITKVRNGIPLEGYCNFCPHTNLVIKE